MFNKCTKFKLKDVKTLLKGVPLLDTSVIHFLSCLTITLYALKSVNIIRKTKKFVFFSNGLSFIYLSTIIYSPGQSIKQVDEVPIEERRFICQ